jgi:uncharacterized protein YegP (UPF0339 family)
VTKLVRCVVLAAAIAGVVSAAALPSAPAQEKKTKKEATKDEAVGTVEMNKDVKGMYRFKVVGEDGKTIMQSSKGYEKKEDAMKAIDTVKSIMSKAKVTEGKGGDDKDEKKDKKDAKKEPEKK